MRIAKIVAVLGMAMAVSACGSSDKAEDAAAETADVGALPADAGMAATSGLGVYVDKYPFDKVGDFAFFEQPSVAAAVTAAVTDADVRNWVMGTEGGPSAPIARKDDKIASWACEQHNCGNHQWTVLMAEDGSAAEVCYQNFDTMPGKTRWFRTGAAPETRGGTCQL